MHLKHQYDQILTSIIPADIKTFMKEEILTLQMQQIELNYCLQSKNFLFLFVNI